MTRPRHEMTLWHTSYTSNGTAITSNFRPFADGAGGVGWSPTEPVLSYASNSNDVSGTGAAGASTLVSRADHAHRGVTSIAHSSNTAYGAVTLTTPGNSVAITQPSAGSFAVAAPISYEPVTHNPGSGPELVYFGDDIVVHPVRY